MPKPTTEKPKVQAPTAPVALKAKSAEASTRPILYPEVDVKICQGEDALTAEQAKKLLKWETEEDYEARLKAEGKTKVPKFGEEYLLKDGAGRKVQCWNNLINGIRFDPVWCKKICQDILNGNWKFNLETIIVSKFGTIVSGQHRLIALILAVEAWSGPDRHMWAEKWPTEPTIETLVAFGGEEESETLRTIDNTKPRSLSDEFGMSSIFAKLSMKDRKECARMLDNGIKYLWKRTGAGAVGAEKYLTHSTALEFNDRHPRMLKCIAHLFKCNSERSLSILGMPSMGRCAALMYMMACSGSDVEDYQAGLPRTEKALTFKDWDRAAAFWTQLSQIDDKDTRPVRRAIAGLTNPETGTKATEREKLVVVCKAWALFAKNYPIKEADVKPVYEEGPDGNMRLADSVLGVGGIDLGDEADPDDPMVSVEEVEQAKAQVKAERAKELQAKVEADGVARFLNKIKELKEKHDNAVLLFKGKTHWIARVADATAVAMVLKRKTTKVAGFYQIDVPHAELDLLVKLLHADGRDVALCEGTEENIKVTMRKRPAAAPSAKPAPKPTPAKSAAPIPNGTPKKTSYAAFKAKQLADLEGKGNGAKKSTVSDHNPHGF